MRKLQEVKEELNNDSSDNNDEVGTASFQAEITATFNNNRIQQRLYINEEESIEEDDVSERSLVNNEPMQSSQNVSPHAGIYVPGT
jgi:hypothetical protein